MGTDTMEPFDPDVAEAHLNQSDASDHAYSELLLRRSVQRVRELEIRVARLTWASALRSGKYAQGTARLRTLDNEYCCLGVAHETLGGEWKLDTSGEIFRTININANGGDYSCSASIRYHPSMERLGLSNEDHDLLTSLNDNAGFSFQEIADVVESAGTNPGDIAEFVRALDRYTSTAQNTQDVSQ